MTWTIEGSELAEAILRAEKQDRKLLLQELVVRPTSSQSARVYAWRIAIICVLLNQTKRQTGWIDAAALLDRFNTPAELSACDETDIARVIHGGLQNVKARSVVGLSTMADLSYDPPSWPGVGDYALQAIKLFVDRTRPRDLSEISDGHLRDYARANWLGLDQKEPW